MSRKIHSTYCPKKVLNVELNIGERYNVLEKIGQGSFGDIFKAFDTVRNQLVAVKLERKEKQNQQGMLMKEAKILEELEEYDNYPKLIQKQQSEELNFIVMSFLGQNLESIKRTKGGAFDPKTVLMMGVQMIHSLEILHSHNYIHRDIKPENFVIGNEGNHHIVYLIDFGLSKKYIDENNQHIPFVEGKGLVGTARYTSINSHMGTEQSRRDDLESLGYVLIYLAKGSLQWQNFQCENRNEKFKKILEKKKEISLQNMCEDIPQEFVQYMTHVKSLKFTDSPNYQYLKKLFIDKVAEINKQNEFSGGRKNINCFDWCGEKCNLEFAPFFKKEQYQDFRAEDISEHPRGDVRIVVPYLLIEENFFQKNNNLQNNISNNQNKNYDNHKGQNMQHFYGNKNNIQELNYEEFSQNNSQIQQNQIDSKHLRNNTNMTLELNVSNSPRDLENQNEKYFAENQIKSNLNKIQNQDQKIDKNPLINNFLQPNNVFQNNQTIKIQ